MPRPPVTTVRLPRQLKAAVDAEADAQGVSRSRILVEGAASRVGLCWTCWEHWPCGCGDAERDAVGTPFEDLEAAQ